MSFEKAFPISFNSLFKKVRQLQTILTAFALSVTHPLWLNIVGLIAESWSLIMSMWSSISVGIGNKAIRFFYIMVFSKNFVFYFKF